MSVAGPDEGKAVSTAPLLEKVKRLRQLGIETANLADEVARDAVSLSSPRDKTARELIQEILADGVPRRPSDLADDTGRSRATCHQILRSLLEQGIVKRAGRGRWAFVPPDQRVVVDTSLMRQDDSAPDDEAEVEAEIEAEAEGDDDDGAVDPAADF